MPPNDRYASHVHPEPCLQRHPGLGLFQLTELVVGGSGIATSTTLLDAPLAEVVSRFDAAPRRRYAPRRITPRAEGTPVQQMSGSLTATRLAPLLPRSKVWLERDGEVVLSEWRVALLEAVAETGSLAGAASQLNVPYRTAWTRLRQIEAGLGFKVLDTQTGGPEGGGSTLTPRARETLASFHRVADGIAGLVDSRFRAEFGDER